MASSVVSDMLLICALLFAFPVASRSLRNDLPEDLQGKPVDPFKMSNSRVVVLLFVRTDCPISNRYAPAIQKLSEEFHDRANFWLVYPDAAESPELIRAHRAEFRYSIPVLPIFIAA